MGQSSSQKRWRWPPGSKRIRKWRFYYPGLPSYLAATHGRITPEQRAAAGISDGLLRVAVGREALVDLQNDLDAGLALI